jgi:glycosyltransferase involved in cell wall biosynthesis
VTDPFVPGSAPFVTVIIPIRNEANFIADTLGAVLEQDYPHDQMEVIMVDGLSTDNTREIVQEVTRQTRDRQTEDQSPIHFHLLDNPARIVPAALNAGICRAKGEIIIRVDGHTIIAPDYVRQCVEALQRTHADNAGGTQRAVGMNAFSDAVALATSTPFGVGGARFHYSDKEEWVDTVYLGAWPRRVFSRIGLFDEELVRDQDDEFNYRLRRSGGRILHSPRIKSFYSARSRFIPLVTQYFQYGFWKVSVLQKNPRQMRLRQFVPPLFVAALLGSALLASFSSWGLTLLGAVGGAYLVANGVASFSTAARNGWRHLPLLPVIYATLHLSYGLGFLLGLIRFVNRWGDKEGCTPRFPDNPDGMDVV